MPMLMPGLLKLKPTCAIAGAAQASRTERTMGRKRMGSSGAWTNRI